MKGKRSYQQSYLRRRSRGSFFTSLVSISLVLFFMGLFMSITLFGNAFAKKAQESTTLAVELLDGISDERLQKLENYLHEQPYVLGLIYISKEEALNIFIENTAEEDEGGLDLLGGVSPLPASFKIRLEPKYLQADSLAKIEQQLKQELIVSNVEYPLENIQKLNKNIRTFSVLFLGIGLLLTAIAFYLIFGTIKLAIYAQRLAIRSMQLIGASRSFIRKPFLIRGLSQGGIAGLIAGLLLVPTVLIISQQLYTIDLNLGSLLSPKFIGLLTGIVLFGLTLGFSGSYFAVNKYLNKNLDELM